MIRKMAFGVLRMMTYECERMRAVRQEAAIMTIPGT